MSRVKIKVPVVVVGLILHHFELLRPVQMVIVISRVNGVNLIVG